MDRLESFGHLREVDTDKSRVTAVISTGDVARDGAIIDPEGWDFSNYDRNPVVLWMHDDTSMPFARTVERMATNKELIARAEFDMEDPMGAMMFRKIANGYVNATSVRWLPKKTEWRAKAPAEDSEDKDKEEKILWFLEQELLEWSFVTIPADPAALILRADGSPFSIADYVPTTYRPDLAWLRVLGPNVDLSWLRDLEERPYANEHACRLRDPGAFQPDSFRRVRREHEGKRYDVIMGRLKGKTSMTEQAYRYPKDTWTSGAARSHCKGHDGKLFEPAASACVGCNGNGQHDTQELERLLVRYFERRNRRLDVDDMVVKALSRATGKSEERVRREMAGGGL